MHTHYEDVVVSEIDHDLRQPVICIVLASALSALTSPERDSVTACEA